jgi:hypothetical protein
MLRIILTFGIAAGLLVAFPMFLSLTNLDLTAISNSMFVGFLIMALAFSMIFVGVKRYRDQIHGGTVKFLPALAVGLGISAVASIVYVIGWEISLAATNNAFIDSYATFLVESVRAKAGVTPAEIQKAMTEAEAFKTMYANPLIRLPMTFIEIFPVGLLVSLIAAALLRNSRFLPARARLNG